MKDKSTIKIVIYLLVISIMLLVLVGAAFYVQKGNSKTKKQIIEEDSIYMQYVDSNTYVLKSNEPVSDSDAKKDNEKVSGFDFSVVCRSSMDLDYEIAISKDKKVTVDNKAVHFYLEKQNSGTYSKVGQFNKYIPLKKKSKLGSPKGSMVLGKAKCSEGLTETYRIKMWVAEGNTVPDGVYKIKVNLYTDGN